MFLELCIALHILPSSWGWVGWGGNEVLSHSLQVQGVGTVGRGVVPHNDSKWEDFRQVNNLCLISRPKTSVSVRPR